MFPCLCTVNTAPSQRGIPTRRGQQPQKSVRTINQPKQEPSSLAEHVEEFEPVRYMMETILADNKRSPDLFLLMVIGSDTHRVLLCDLREVADECGTLDDLLRRAVAGEDRVLVKREERLERCAPERVECIPSCSRKSI